MTTTYYKCERCGKVQPAASLKTDSTGVHCKRPCVPAAKIELARRMGNFETAAGDPGDSIHPS